MQMAHDTKNPSLRHPVSGEESHGNPIRTPPRTRQLLHTGRPSVGAGSDNRIRGFDFGAREGYVLRAGEDCLGVREGPADLAWRREILGAPLWRARVDYVLQREEVRPCGVENVHRIGLARAEHGAERLRRGRGDPGGG